MRRKKYFKTRAQARKALQQYKSEPFTILDDYDIYRMPKGSRHPGMYAVCSYVEFINTY